jgi:hypothetical protein
MRMRKAIGLVLAMVVAGLALAAAAEDRTKLSYGWNAGQQLRYSVYVVGRIEASNEPVQDVKLRRQSIWEVTEADPDRDRFLMIEKVVGQGGPDVDLRLFGLPSPDEPIQRTVDSLGHVFNIAHYTEGSRFFILPLVFDPKPVAAGDKWTVTPKLEAGPVAGGADTMVNIEYVLEKVVNRYKLIEHDCAIIRISAEYDYQAADGGSGVSGDFGGKAVFDLTDHKIIDYQITDHRREWNKANNWTRTATLEVTALEQK